MRRIPLSRRSHIVGFQTDASGLIEHESALERDFVILTRFRDAAAKIVSQPVTLSFLDGIQSRRYTPDFWVRWGDGTAELIEVKYWEDLKKQWSMLRPGFIAARKWAREQGATFRIATQRRIRGPFLENAKRLLALRSVPLDQTLADLVRSVLGSLPDPTFGALAAAVPYERSAVLGALWRMIARGELGADLTVPIGLQTRLRLP